MTDLLPIFFSPNYNITYGGLEKLHVFDSCKWGRIVNFLTEKASSKVKKHLLCAPPEATNEELLLVHTPEYLDSLNTSANVARVLELRWIAAIPNIIIRRNVLKRFRFQVKGTIMAAQKALEKKWAINLGGGFHHASSGGGGGFCVYADISIAIKAIKKTYPEHKFLIIDLDAHQGNGHETDFPPNNNVFIMDIYNRSIYPRDEKAKENITVDVPIISWTNDEQYLQLLKDNLEKCFEVSTPNLVVYNAGTDCLEGDPLGRLSITADGIMRRDEMVFRAAKERNVPIVMVTSGGYQASNAKVIADSILNLFDKDIIA